MLFEAKKLELDSAEELFQCMVSSMKPFSLMLSPVYVLMKRNQKFVSVKAPLDFFTPDELESLLRYEEFFIPKSVEAVTGFRSAARMVGRILDEAGAGFPPAPFEISNEVISVLAPQWGRSLVVSPFCAAIFADELCGNLEPGELLLGRDSAVVKHDQGLLLSGLLVFTLVHLGWSDPARLREIRSVVYSRTIRGEDWSAPEKEWEWICSDLLRVLDLKQDLGPESLRECPSAWAFDLSGRLKRIASRGRILEERGIPALQGGFSW
jgi:hypothetical protein